MVTIATILDHSRTSPHSLAVCTTSCGQQRGARRKFLHSSESQLCRCYSCHLCLFAPHVSCNTRTLLSAEATGLAKSQLALTWRQLSICVLFVLLIIFFTYFWTATQFRPDQIASDMKKNGAFIPGIRQGKPTQDYLEDDHEPHHLDRRCIL